MPETRLDRAVKGKNVAERKRRIRSWNISMSICRRILRFYPVKWLLERFHSRLSAVRKTYCYQLEMGPKKDVFQRNYYYGLGERLDVSAMKAAAGLLTGTHDFKSFCGNKKMKKSTVRTIEKIEFEQSGSRLHIYFTGNGFLQQMVRILTGTLIEVGQGKCAPDKITRILDAQDRQAAGPTAPAQGLFLVNVGYEDK